MGTCSRSGLEAAPLGVVVEELSLLPDMAAAGVPEAAVEPTPHGLIPRQGVGPVGEPRDVVAVVTGEAMGKAPAEGMAKVMVEVTARAEGAGGWNNRPSARKTCKMKSIDRCLAMQTFHTTSRGIAPTFSRSIV